jgi:hypothetical protein
MNDGEWEKQKQGWDQWLDQWEREVYVPLFQPRGFGRDAALMLWCMQMQISGLRKFFEKQERLDKPWLSDGDPPE